MKRRYAYPAPLLTSSEVSHAAKVMSAHAQSLKAAKAPERARKVSEHIAALLASMENNV